MWQNYNYNRRNDALDKKVRRGSLISFNYPRSLARKFYIIHDPYPLVLVTDIWPQYIRGINLHYLTFPYIRRLLLTYSGNNSFTYDSIKGDKYLVSAFRKYYRNGIYQPKKLDTEFLVNVLASVRTLHPSEIENIRIAIENQIQQKIQQSAMEMSQGNLGLNEMSSQESYNTNQINNALFKPL